MEIWMNIIFPVMIYVLGGIVLIALIALILRLIKTLGKIDKVVDDVNYKSNKLNGVFDLVGTTTDTLSFMGDKLATGLVSKVSSMFDKKTSKKEEE